MQEKEIKDSDSQLKLGIHALRDSAGALKECKISCSHRTGMAANQMGRG